MKLRLIIILALPFLFACSLNPEIQRDFDARFTKLEQEQAALLEQDPTAWTSARLAEIKSEQENLRAEVEATKAAAFTERATKGIEVSDVFLGALAPAMLPFFPAAGGALAGVAGLLGLITGKKKNGGLGLITEKKKNGGIA